MSASTPCSTRDSKFPGFLSLPLTIARVTFVNSRPLDRLFAGGLPIPGSTATLITYLSGVALPQSWPVSISHQRRSVEKIPKGVAAVTFHEVF